MRHEAIYKIYPNAIRIGDDQGAFDKEGNKIEIDEKKIKAEQTRLEDGLKSKHYQRERIYPSIGDQLDMIYWDKVNGTEKWKESIEKVKAKYPKPE